MKNFSRERDMGGTDNTSIVLPVRLGCIRNCTSRVLPKKFITQINQDLVDDCLPKNSYPEQWEVDVLENELMRIYGLKTSLKEIENFDSQTPETILKIINKNIDELFDKKEQLYGEEIIRKIEKQIFLVTLDNEWKDHLHSLDKLRQGINLRAYAQKDPLIEYKKDGFNLYEDMLLRLEEQVVSRLAHVEISLSRSENSKIDLVGNIKKTKTIESRNDFNSFDENENLPIKNLTPIRTKVDPNKRDPKNPNSWGDVGRNESCPCGSGKKYKNCHSN
jgi:preprotein translocase subunit SecA